MKFISVLTASMLVAGGSAAPLRAAHADTVLLDSIDVIEGQQSFTDGFDVTSPGVLTVTLSTIPWLDNISNLGGFVSTDSGVIGTAMTVGTESFIISGPGNIYTHWSGDASGPYNLGVLGVKIDFQPNGVAAVPLPASLLLMLSGLGVLFGWQRRSAPPMTHAQAEAQA